MDLVLLNIISLNFFFFFIVKGYTLSDELPKNIAEKKAMEASQ